VHPGYVKVDRLCIIKSKGAPKCKTVQAVADGK
jgi:hypothetical protein